MPDIRVVVVGPKFEGNVGAIARCMANFGVEDLVLVNPCEIGETAMNRSKHGDYILRNARTVTSMEEAVEGCLLVVGTSGTVTKGDKNYARIPVDVREFAMDCRGYNEKIAFVFGREDIGLLQTELNRCDVLITIPADDKYPVMNLSHSVGVILYEMFQANRRPVRCEPCDGREKELLRRPLGGDRLQRGPEGIHHRHVQTHDGQGHPHQIRIQHDNGRFRRCRQDNQELSGERHEMGRKMKAPLPSSRSP